ncbi:MAG: hypothetical protein JWO87_1334 [Phycisphaerales bacterium]|nr:hypothetical protein [Phycisphaerales bacterium]
MRLAVPGRYDGRMLRRLFTFASALSLVLCVATTTKWIAHTKLYDVLEWAGRKDPVKIRVWRLAVGRGNIEFFAFTTDAAPYSDISPGEFRHEWFGRPAPARPVAMYNMRLPLWSVTVATAPLPIAWYVRYRRRLKRAAGARHGLCRSCGYDLTSNVSGICPECGIAVKVTPPRA